MESADAEAARIYSARVLLRVALSLLLTTVATLLVTPTASAASQSLWISDPADGRPSIDGRPEPDVAGVGVVQDGDRVTITVTFHGPALANGSSTVYSAWLPFSVGVTHPEYSQMCSDVAELSVGFASGDPWGDYNVNGATGSLPFTSGPTFNPDRTQLSWSMTHPALAQELDCIDVGPLYGHRYSTISHPDSRYNAACDCWTLFQSLDDLKEHSSDTDYWFPGKIPPADLIASLTTVRPIEGKSVELTVSGYGESGGTRTATASWFLGAQLLHRESAVVTAGGQRVFTFTPGQPGSYRVALGHESGVVTTRDFSVADDPNIPSPTSLPPAESESPDPKIKWRSLKTTGTPRHPSTLAKFRICADRGPVRIDIRGTFFRTDGSKGTFTKRILRRHPEAGCTVERTSWEVKRDWRGPGRRVFKARLVANGRATTWRRYSYTSRR